MKLFIGGNLVDSLVSKITSNRFHHVVNSVSLIKVTFGVH